MKNETAKFGSYKYQCNRLPEYIADKMLSKWKISSYYLAKLLVANLIYNVCSYIIPIEPSN